MPINDPGLETRTHTDPYTLVELVTHPRALMDSAMPLVDPASATSPFH